MRSSIHILVILLSILLSAHLTFAQKRYLVNSYGDAIPIPIGSSAKSEIQKQTQGKTQATNGEAVCIPKLTAGNLPWEHNYPGAYASFVYAHRDVIGVWFETPAAGAIDSVYVQLSDYSGTAFPGQLTLRIHHSNLSTGHAPGWIPYNPPPILCWGYYDNIYDTDTHLAAFVEDASDTNWQSTYNRNNWGWLPLDHYYEFVDTTVFSFPPAAEEIWGTNGGLDMPAHNGQISGFDLSSLGRPQVPKDYPIFISFTVPGNHPANMGTNPPFTDPTRLAIVGNDDRTGGSTGDHSDGDPRWSVRRQFHNYKFYEHPSVCGPGWLARGDDHLFIWYVMSVTGDAPPTFLSYDHLGHTLQQTGTRTIQAEIEDCNFGEGGTGVDSARLVYNIDSGIDNIVQLDLLGGATYQGTIPATSCPNTVRYHLEAVDINGNMSSTQTVTYRTLCLRTGIAFADTGAARSYTGNLYSDPAANVIDTSKWFAPSFYDPNNTRWDDGTAGPFAFGSFPFCGDTMHYAWVGVNGAMALSKTASDTIHLNSNGSYAAFKLPGYIHKAAPDNTTLYGVPRNFLAPMWGNLIIGDSLNTLGHLYYKNEAGRFIVEWDSVGTFNSSGTVPENEIFRVVLNKTDGAIEYQYDKIGYTGLDSACIVGVQSDSSNPDEFHGFVLLNEFGYPRELRPRNNWAVKLWQFIKIDVRDGWNLITLPGNPLPGSNYLKKSLFPDAASQAFGYQQGYKPKDTLRVGMAYWMKFVGEHIIGVPSVPFDSLDISLAKGWNMVGIPGRPIQVSSLTTTPPDILGPFWSFTGMYEPADTLFPGVGYWVKASEAGILHTKPPISLQKKVAKDDLSKLNTITMRGGGGSQVLYLGDQSLVKGVYELPPAPPAGSFDARFASQQMVETYPSSIEAGKEYQYIINFQSASYPVTVNWNITKQPEGRTLVLTDGINGTIINSPMTGTGSIRITNASVKTLIVKLGEDVPAIPKEFALSRNYPNPFNPTTRFVVEMPKSADVEVTVYDILGQRIATLLSGEQAAGYHTVEWNGTNQAGLNVPSGTYFIRMISENFTGVQKVMLIK
jgi:hypothetical protein